MKVAFEMKITVNYSYPNSMNDDSYGISQYNSVEIIIIKGKW